MSIGIKIKLNEGLYLKNPQDSDLGRKILQQSINLINEIGFESFNFKKLASKINSTEASIYRYFENKHVLLIYLISWYWEWLNYLIYLKTLNITNPKEKLKIVIKTFIFANNEKAATDFINQENLHNLVITEGTKTYHSKAVDDENRKGFFLSYKNLVAEVAEIIKEVNPQFPYPHALASNLFEMANHHVYCADHLPKLTDVHHNTNNEVEMMLNYFTDKLLQ
ncbi:MAG TPA: TetR/AcrR family transcriptional regulator [Flavobacteriia bacterium]|nr:TetR/AcrR family transcriptional regulator [Flavobacteriia bacterium]